jgi:cytochrome c oxidase subunit 2
VGKWWSVLFGVIMVAAGGLFVVAPFVGWWLPERVSEHAWDIDLLFYIILGITGFFFILTEALLVYFMWAYAARPGGHGHVFGHHAEEQKVFWTSYFKWLIRPVSAVLHNQHRVELAWTLVPAVILLYITFAQVSAWARVKYLSRMPKLEALPLQVEVSARQFEWRMRYASPARWAEWRADKDAAKDFAMTPHADDVHVVNELHCWRGHPVVVQLRTIDVLHSFNIPYMRVKQDALPGKVIPVWFTSRRETEYEQQEGKAWYNTKKVTDKQGNVRWVDGYNPETRELGESTRIWEIACAELCGWGHYRMIGRVYVHENEQDFLHWLRDAEKKQRSTQPETPTTAAR